MELTQAIQLLNEAIIAKRAEIDTLTLALVVLESRFVPELTVLDNARLEVVNAKAEAEIGKLETNALKTRVTELEGLIPKPVEAVVVDVPVEPDVVVV